MLRFLCVFSVFLQRRGERGHTGDNRLVFHSRQAPAEGVKPLRADYRRETKIFGCLIPSRTLSPLFVIWHSNDSKLEKSTSFRRKMLRERGSFPAKSPNWEEPSSASGFCNMNKICTVLREHRPHLSCALIPSRSLPAFSTVNSYHAHESREHVVSMSGCVFKKNSTSNKLRRCNQPLWDLWSSSWKPMAVWRVIRSDHRRSTQAAYGLHGPPEKVIICKRPPQGSRELCHLQNRHCHGPANTGFTLRPENCFLPKKLLFLKNWN